MLSVFFDRFRCSSNHSLNAILTVVLCVSLSQNRRRHHLAFCVRSGRSETGPEQRTLVCYGLFSHPNLSRTRNRINSSALQSIYVGTKLCTQLAGRPRSHPHALIRFRSFRFRLEPRFNVDGRELSAEAQNRTKTRRCVCVSRQLRMQRPVQRSNADLRHLFM